MSVTISPISAPSLLKPLDLDKVAASGTQFQDVLHSAIRQVESSRASANTAIQGFLSGEDGELHSTILATQKAELQFNLFMQARNKIVSAYEEVMRMQV